MAPGANNVAIRIGTVVASPEAPRARRDARGGRSVEGDVDGGGAEHAAPALRSGRAHRPARRGRRRARADGTARCRRRTPARRRRREELGVGIAQPLEVGEVDAAAPSRCRAGARRASSVAGRACSQIDEVGLAAAAPRSAACICAYRRYSSSLRFSCANSASLANMKSLTMRLREHARLGDRPDLALALEQEEQLGLERVARACRRRSGRGTGSRPAARASARRRCARRAGARASSCRRRSALRWRCGESARAIARRSSRSER